MAISTQPRKQLFPSPRIRRDQWRSPPSCDVPSLVSAGRRPIREYQSLVLANPSAGNGGVSIEKVAKRISLLASCYQPKNLPSAIDDRIRERHPLSTLIEACYGDIPVNDLQYRITRNQRGGVSIWPEAQVHEIKNRRRSRHLLEGARIIHRGAQRVRRFHRHRVNLLRIKRRAF